MAAFAVEAAHNVRRAVQLEDAARARGLVEAVDVLRDDAAADLADGGGGACSCCCAAAAFVVATDIVRDPPEPLQPRDRLVRGRGPAGREGAPAEEAAGPVAGPRGRAGEELLHLFFVV